MGLPAAISISRWRQTRVGKFQTIANCMKIGLSDPQTRVGELQIDVNHNEQINYPTLGLGSDYSKSM